MCAAHALSAKNGRCNLNVERPPWLIATKRRCFRANKDRAFIDRTPSGRGILQ